MSERKTCTKEMPMPKGDTGRWIHPDAIYESDDYGKGGGVSDGDYEVYNCPHCGKRFKVELPN
jgi:hypothetical protein